MDTCSSLPSVIELLATTHHVLPKLSHIETVLSFTSENMCLQLSLKAEDLGCFHKGILISQRERRSIGIWTILCSFFKGEPSAASSNPFPFLLLICSFHSSNAEISNSCVVEHKNTAQKRSGRWLRGQKNMVWSIGVFVLKNIWFEDVAVNKTSYKCGISLWRQGHKSLVGSIGVINFGSDVVWSYMRNEDVWQRTNSCRNLGLTTIEDWVISH